MNFHSYNFLSRFIKKFKKSDDENFLIINIQYYKLIFIKLNKIIFIKNHFFLIFLLIFSGYLSNNDL